MKFVVMEGVYEDFDDFVVWILIVWVDEWEYK